MTDRRASDGADPVEHGIDGSPAAIVAAADAAVAHVSAVTAAALAASAATTDGPAGPDPTGAFALARAPSVTSPATGTAPGMAAAGAGGPPDASDVPVAPADAAAAAPDVAGRLLARQVTALALGAVGFALIQTYVYAVTRDLPTGLTALAGGTTAAWLYVIARRLARAGRLSSAVVATAGAAIGLTAVVAVAYPQAVLIVVGLPAVAVAFALPFSDRRTLLWIMVASWIAEVGLVVAAEVLIPTTKVPEGVLAVLRVSGLAITAAVSLALLWAYSQKFSEALTRMATGNLAVRAAEEKVGQINEELRHRVEELEQRSREMSQLAKLGDLLQSCETSEEAYAVIAQTAGPLFQGDSGVLYELTGNRTVVEQVAAWGENSSSGSVFAPSECWALRRGRTYVVEDSGTELLCAHVGDATPAGYMCIPLTAQSETLGLLHIEIGHKVRRSRRAEHLADRMRTAVTLSEHLSLALANFRLRATLREHSTRDELTGLFNRRYMEDSLDREIRRAIRDGESLGVLMLDLDHFKRLNDAYGHAAGDFALRLVGQFLQANVRSEDIACRFGGEEFVVILPKANSEDTRRRGEALRLGIRSLRADHGGPTFPTLTVSVGVAAYPHHGATGEGVLRAADEALYRAKAEGRDRVVVAELPRRQPLSVSGQ